MTPPKRYVVVSSKGRCSIVHAPSPEVAAEEGDGLTWVQELPPDAALSFQVDRSPRVDVQKPSDPST